MGTQMQANLFNLKPDQNRRKADISALGHTYQGKNSGTSNERWLMRLQKLIVQFCILSLSLFLLTACESDDSESPAASATLAITPASLSLAMGISSQLTATLNDTDVTTSATWSSSDTSILLISDTTGNAEYPMGTITALRTGGPVTVSATYEGQTATASIEVTSATLDSLQVTPLYPSVALNATPEIQFTATGVFSDNTKLDLTEYCTWNSGTPATATVNNTVGNRGLVSTLRARTTIITAVYPYPSGDVSGSSKLTLTSGAISSLEVTPIDPTISSNSTLQFAATALIDDGTTQDLTKDVIWSSGTVGVAVISNAENSQGMATADASTDTSTDIDASYGGIAASTTPDNSSHLNVPDLTVSDDLVNLQVLPSKRSIATGIDFQLAAKGIFNDGTYSTHEDLTKSVLWASSDSDVATVCNSMICKGRVTPRKAGTVTITVTIPDSDETSSSTLTVNGTGKSLVEIQVTPTNPSIYLDTDQKFTATGIYTDGTTYFHEDITANVTWSSPSGTVVVVSNAAGSEGMAKNRAAGTATITATRGEISGKSDLTVLATAMALTDIEVSPTNPNIADGMKQQFTAVGVFTDGTTTVLRDITSEVVWTSATVATAKISNTPGSKGEAVSVLNGTSLITADLGGVSGTSTLTVIDVSTYVYNILEIVPEPNAMTLGVGASQKFEAVGIFDDATVFYKMDLTDAVTWVSDLPSVATVDNRTGSQGLVRGVKAGGPATITAYWTDANGRTKSDTKTITVSAADMALQSIQISPSNQSLDLGMTQQYEALGIFTDGTDYAVNHLPPELAWISVDSTSDSTINVPIGSDVDHHGLATTLTAGTSTISAKSGSIGATETLTTANLTLQSWTISPANPTIVDGAKLQFRAHGTYSDGVNRDITDLLRWRSGTETTALIRNSLEDKGLATALDDGTSTISAELGGTSVTTTLTVRTNTDAAFPVQLTPSSPVIGVGTTMQLSATGVLTDVTTYSDDLTKQVYWVSATPTVVRVSNSPDSNGRVYGVAAGTSVLTAYWTDGVAAPNSSSGTVTVTVTSGVTSIEITPDQPSGPVGFSQQLTATALYSDSNTQDISESVVWTSSDTSKVTVSNAEGSRGMITRIAVGSATITGRFGTNSTTATVTVW